ncbi:hypothetical protein FEM48_Zijuj02G0185700 [Ziziphus jujuba var. spinosa]|uniref:F-box domain-containing protein n=1 Tax=Ziziphus jujuba var. spinosa TaxID=714518 RepID=A0A978VXA7_ZIZJJ|nr:hypothetical protein FEM48_Zijuj02G0185700 [Ziziphus jujuba var. spinosa]
MEDLPKELVISILLRLPAEDLRRCKSVCKSLYSIITSRPFIEVRRKTRNSYILVKYEDLISNNHVISLLCDETLEIVYTQTILSDTPLMDSMSSKDRVVKVVGCCNGVVSSQLVILCQHIQLKDATVAKCFRGWYVMTSMENMSCHST